MDNNFVVLGGIGYQVSVEDGQVIFEERGGIYGMINRFAFEKPREINNTPGIWYLVELAATTGRIPASHVIQAYEWCCDNYGKSFEDKKGVENER